MLKTFSHKPSLMCLCATCTEYRAYYLVGSKINWANGSLLDRTLRVDLTPPKGAVLAKEECLKNGLRRLNDPTKDVLIGVR